jgi:hypothetical protein
MNDQNQYPQQPGQPNGYPPQGQPQYPSAFQYHAPQPMDNANPNMAPQVAPQSNPYYAPQGVPQQPTQYPPQPQQGYAPQYAPPQPNMNQPGAGYNPVPKNIPNRKSVAVKLIELMYVLMIILESTLAVRFVMKILGANVANPVVTVFYDISDVFVRPFKGFFTYNVLNNTAVLQSRLEWETLVAMMIYALGCFLIIKMIDLFR